MLCGAVFVSMKKIFRISILIIITAGLLFFSSATAQELQIFQTNSTNGHLFPCRCPSEPKGGLAKQATLIKKLAGGRPYWLLESGDIFGINTDRASDSLVLAAYQALKYQAVAVGDQELAKGGDHFLQVKARFDIPFVSANLLYRGKALVPPYRILSAGNPPVKAAVIGLISSKTLLYYPKEKLEGLEILPPEPALRSLIDSLKSKVDLFILVSHLGFEEELEIAKKFPELVADHRRTQPDRAGEAALQQWGADSRVRGQRQAPDQDHPGTGGWPVAVGGIEIYGITSDLPDDSVVSKIIGPMPDYLHHNTDTGSSAKIERSAVHIFVAPDCPDCKKLEDGLFKRITRQYSGRLKIQYHMVDDPGEYKLLLGYERLLNDRNNQLPAVVINDRILGGVAEIEKELERLIKETLARQSLEKPQPKSKATESLIDKSGRLSGKTMETETADSIYLAFISNARCQKCGRAEYMLNALQAEYPSLSVRKFDLQTKQDKVMAEAMGILYDLPGDKRMIAPTAYIGDDYLIDDQIDDVSLSVLSFQIFKGHQADSLGGSRKIFNPGRPEHS